MDSLPPELFSVEQMVGLKRAQSVALSPCGKWVAAAFERLANDGSKYFCDIWRIPVDGKRGGQVEPIQLTSGSSRDTDLCFRADGALGFLSDRVDAQEPSASVHGRKQIWLLPALGGEPYRLTNEALGVRAYKFARKGEGLALLSPFLPDVAQDQQRATDTKIREQGPSILHYHSMPVRFWDHWLPTEVQHLIWCKADASERRDLTPLVTRELLHAEFDISSDGQQVMLTWAREGLDRIADVALMWFDLRTEGAVGDAQGRLLAEQALSEASCPLFSSDGTQLVYRRKMRPPHVAPHFALQLLDLSSIASSQESLNVVADWDAWPVPAAWHGDGKSLFVLAEERGMTSIYALELKSGDVIRLTHEASHSHLCYEEKRELLIGLRASLSHPPEVFVLPCNDSAELHFPVRLSGFDASHIAHQVRQLQVTSTDGVAIQSWLLLPENVPEGQALPALLWIHGGPINAWLDSWHWRWNPLLAVAQGYAVIMPNPRGSTGFGQVFVDGIWGNQWGAQCYEDVMAVADAAAQLPEIDSMRIAAMGGSFGGYMTNWIGTQNTRFNCLVTHASLFSMSTFTSHVDLPAEWYATMDEEPYTDPVKFDRYSPSRYVANWKTPTLILHGAKDFRVPVNESLALFEALQYHGVQSELVIFPDEHHWIFKPNNTVAWYETIFKFLRPYLQS